MVGKKDYKDIASMQNPGSQRTGMAGGGRSTGVPDAEPDTGNGDRGPGTQYSAQGHPLRVVGRSSYHSDAKKALRKNPPPKSVRDIRGIGPGYKKGGRATRAKGGKTKR
jgi:hypothetical protein